MPAIEVRCAVLLMASSQEPTGLRRQHWIWNNRPHVSPGDAYVAAPEARLVSGADLAGRNWILPGAVDRGRIEAQSAAAGMIEKFLRAKLVAPSSRTQPSVLHAPHLD
jgi:hypothetical protein